jgi:hypothetical protein
MQEGTHLHQVFQELTIFFAHCPVKESVCGLHVQVAAPDLPEALPSMVESDLIQQFLEKGWLG